MKNLTLKRSDLADYNESDGISLQSYFLIRNNCYPNSLMFSYDKEGYKVDVKGIMKYLKSNFTEDEYEMSIYNTYSIRDKKDHITLFMWIKKYDVYIKVDEDITLSYVLYADENKEGIDFAKKLIKKYYKCEKKKEPNKFYLISSDNGGYKLLKGNNKKFDNFDIEKLYNDDFPKENEKIEEFIKNDENGLIILHGIKGSGKTSYIRSLISKYSNKHRFIYVPSNLIGMIGDPSFNDFLFTLKNSIIILEDCETIIQSRSSYGNNSGVSTILNMSDGLLGDMFNIKFICTFNENVSKIDEALLRKGRLVSKYEFKELSKEKTAAMLNELYGIEDYDGKGLTLADIFNFNSDSYENERKKIGFDA